MRYNIKAIETEYKGHWFRSRLEARWAAFFDLCGWKWTYEPADFNGWFPDFALHGVNDVFVEVKPDTTFPQDVADKIDASGCEHECLILGSACPLPSSNRRSNGSYCGAVHIGWLKEVFGDGSGSSWSEAAFGEWNKVRDFCHNEFSYRARMSGAYDGSSGSNISYDDTVALWGAAQRQTRYEHGAKKTAHRTETKTASNDPLTAWKEMSCGLNSMLGDFAGQAICVDAISNVWTVYFPAGAGKTIEFCNTRKPDLQNALTRHVKRFINFEMKVLPKTSHKIKLTTSQNEAWRMTRLANLVSCLEYSSAVLGFIEELKDEKGFLVCVWKANACPVNRFYDQIREAWAGQNEPMENVEFEYAQ